MIKYCEGTFCRHSVFSKHFGDAPPECKKRCDTCKVGLVHVKFYLNRAGINSSRKSLTN